MNTTALRRLAASRRALTTARIAGRSASTSSSTPVTYGPQEKDPQLNGYPELPNVSRQWLPPTGWWDNQMRRNFGDTLHEKEELYSMWGPDFHKIPPNEALKQITFAFSIFGGIMLFSYLATPTRSAVPREYPFDGLVKELGGLEENKARTEPLESDEE